MSESKFSVLEPILKYYGPFAFGLVTFLAIWFAAVKPELDRANEKKIESTAILKQMVTVSTMTERTAETLDHTATVLERITDKTGE